MVFFGRPLFLGNPGLLSFLILSSSLCALSAPGARADDTTGSTVAIPLNDDGLPASDLIYQNKVISSETAYQLKTQGKVDLSTLSPDPTSDVWNGKVPPQGSSAQNGLDDSLGISSGESTTYLGVISSSAGRFKFNVQVPGAQGAPETFTIMLSETLHTTLMRKELLRRLGYVIPAMKYLPEIKITFPDVNTRDFFLTTQLVDATNAAWDQTRWLVAPPTPETVASPTPETVLGQSLVVTLRDVVAMAPTPIIYNVAMGPPVSEDANGNLLAEGPRVLRALAIPYGLLDAPESINQFDWYAGRVANGNVVLSTPDLANFATTLDDALWIFRRIALLTRADFTQIVSNSHFPASVADVVVEKLIARRNALAVSLGLTSVAAIPFNQNVGDPPELVNGKLIDKDWTQDGYASRFAHQTLATPLQDLQWYGLSTVESNVLSNLISYADTQIPSLTVQTDVTHHENDLLSTAIASFLKTGKQQTVHLGAWAAPIASAGLNISRDVVIGDYMGTGEASNTSSFVQLADTFGAFATVGLYVGVDGLPTAINASGQVTGQYSISLTHLKPLTDLKQAVTEPLTEIFVPWVFHNVAGIFDKTAALKDTGLSESADQLKQSIDAELQNLEEFLDVGESLLLTQNIDLSTQAQAGITAPVALSPGAEIQAGGNSIIISRVRFYRKDTNTIQVFKDNGNVNGFNLAFEFVIGTPAVQFPVVKLTGSIEAGQSTEKVYTVNVDPDPANNPQIYSNTSALASALSNGSTEVLDSLQKPDTISIKFTDKSSGFNFLFYLWRSLTSNADISVTLPDSSTTHFISFTDGTQSGFEFQSLATTAANFLVQYLTDNPSLGISTDASSDPGTSFLGRSTTREASFQAVQTSNGSGVGSPFVQVQYRWEGWSISPADMISLTDSLSQKYGFQLFSPGYLGDTQRLQLYELELSLDFYQPAIDAILGISVEDEKNLVTYYNDLNGCVAHISGPQANTDWPANTEICGAISAFQNGLNAYRKGGLSAQDVAKTEFEVTSAFEKFMPFSNLLTWIGGPKNILVGGILSGFRQGSEEGGGKTPPPIYTNTLGQAPSVNASGAINSAESILGVQSGEFEAQWLRDHL